MARTMKFLLFSAGLMGLALPTGVRAQDMQPFEFSLWSPVQIAGEDAHISGIRLNLLYGRNASVSGVDIGLWNETRGSQTGLQWGAVGIVEGDFAGWQNNSVVNIARGEFSGIQAGFFNQTSGGTIGQLGAVNVLEGAADGVRIGAVNVAEEFSGFHLGVVNITRARGSGFQWGVVNSVDDGSGFMLGVVNVARRFRGLQIGLVNVISEKESFPVLPIVNWVF